MVASLRYGLALGALAASLGFAAAEPIRHPTAVFAGLDKTTGRIINFDVAIDETVQFGSLNVTPRVCNTRPQTEAPQTTSFVEVDEVMPKQDRQVKLEVKEPGKPETAKQESKRIFSGWMFAASPGLHGVEHPVYDVWLIDCKGGKETAPVAAAPAQPADAAAAASPDAAAATPETGKKKKSRKVEPKAPAPVENAPIGPSDAAPPQPAVEAAPAAPDAATGEAPAQPAPAKKKKRKPAPAPAAQPAEPQGGGGFFPF